MVRSPSTVPSDVLIGERAPLAAPASSLEKLLADRIASEAARLAENLIREAFAVTEFNPDEVYGFMTSEEARSSWVSPIRASGRSPPRCPGTPSRRRGSGI